MTVQRMAASAELAGPRVDVLDIVSGQVPDLGTAPAVLSPGRTAVSYDALVRTISEGVDRLRSLGVTADDRIAVLAGNDVDGALLLVTVITAAVCCPVNPALAPSEITEYLDVVEPSALIIPTDADAQVREVASSYGRPVIVASSPGKEPGGLLLRAPDAGRVESRRTGRGESLLLRTSGTTAAGKVVPLTMTNIVACATATVRAYHLTPCDRRLNVMPLFHVQGLVGSVIASLLSGSSVVCVDTFEPESALRQLVAYRPTWLSATATMHRLMLDRMTEKFQVPDSLRFIRCGAGALPDALRARLGDAYGVPIIESYGMSEAHQIASTPLPPSPEAVGMAQTGSVVGVVDEAGSIRTAPGSSGEIVISGSNVVKRYVAPQEANDAFLGDWLRTGDLGALADDGSVVISGRRKEIIDSGGEKFSPLEVEEVLLAHPAVRQAVVFPVPDPVLGERAAAAVVLAVASGCREKDLRAFAAGRVAPYKVPRRVLIRDEVPMGPSGKVVRSTLAKTWAAELAAQGPSVAEGTSHPHDATEAALVGLWTYALQCQAVGVEDDFLMLGGDSLKAVSLLAAVESVFHVHISPLTLFDEANTVARMAVTVVNARDSADESE